ncbi:cadherin-16 [Stegostoma tigrinum]|uniref:cadherin-16 n=1 Tax=Stegostoma tigrinum TaxID=3053191 RepID=UPI002870A856|nr:cadherin-16 [Stegostoma tigrinum]
MIPKGFVHLNDFGQIVGLLSALNVLSVAKLVTVPENYEGEFPWFLTRIDLGVSEESRLELVDDYNGTFGIENHLLLFTLQSFDREEQSMYELKVNVTDDEGRQLGDPISIRIIVTDRNDNAPEFVQEAFSAQIHQGAHAGYRILSAAAIDLDDPLLPSSDLRYKILQQIPAQPSDRMFQIDPWNGDISLTAEGAESLALGLVDRYILTVQVKDMGDQPQGHYTRGEVAITVTDNLWLPPSPVAVRENHQGPYPLAVTKVQWNNDEVKYRLQVKPPSPEGPFLIDGEGQIFLTQPLDREQEAEYLLLISAEGSDGELLAEPLELRMLVTDDNDNTPECIPESYQATVREQQVQGSQLITLTAADRDDPRTDNARLYFQLHSQEPRGDGKLLFTVNANGTLTLANDMINYTSLKYQLEVLVADLAGLSSTCSVTVHVEEVNDNVPVFPQRQFGPFTVAEDTDIGNVITTINVSDTDYPVTSSWLVVYTIEAGNDEHRFGISQDEHSNTGSLLLYKALDYEEVNDHRLVVSVRNQAELLGAQYGPSSTATIFIRVQDVNEAPTLPQSQYEVMVPKDAQPGHVLLHLEAHDPDTAPTPVRYCLGNETVKWLWVNPDSGDVTLLSGDPAGGTHLLEVMAEDGDDPSLYTRAWLMIHIEDIHEDLLSPVLQHSGDFLCMPQRDGQSIAINAVYRQERGSRNPISLSIDGKEKEQRNWKLHQANDSHASLTIALSWVDPGVYQIPIILTEKGDPHKHHRDSLTVSICPCNSRGECRLEVEPVPGKPTILTTVGTIVGTLGAIGFFLSIALLYLAVTGKQHQKRKRNVSSESARFHSAV